MLAPMRKAAQSIRHAPLLRSLTPVWDMLRPVYGSLLSRLARNRGVPVTVGGHKMRLAPDVVNVSWERVELEAYKAFEGIILEGDVIFDVGAHFGTYSIIAALIAGQEGTVVAYEPHIETLAYLKRHLAWNGVASRLHVRDVCCGAKRSHATLFCSEHGAAGSNSLVANSQANQREVQIRRLDDEVAELGLVPDVLKIDVEGTELDVLRGAEGTLKKYRPRILLSVHPDALASIGTCENDVYAFLESCGYNYSVVSRDHEVHVLALADVD